MPETAIHKTQEKEDSKQSALRRLRKLLPPGSKVYTFVSRRPRNGVGGYVLFMAVDRGEITNIGGLVSDILGCEWQHDATLLVDSPFSVVSELSLELHGSSQGQGIKDDRYHLAHCNPDPKNWKAGYSLHHVVL